MGAGDILNGDWNPVIGCERYSAGCRLCWYLDGIFPWQQRLGNIPKTVDPSDMHVFEARLTEKVLKQKKGIIGVVQHGDLFRDAVPTALIHSVLSIIDTVAREKPGRADYILWTKRAARMASVLYEHYERGSLPEYLSVSVSAENQVTADERFPYLRTLWGRKILMLEPLIGPVTLLNHLPADWVVVGSETGPEGRPIPLSLDWVRAVRDETKAAGIPFFIKQLGPSHKKPERSLDGREWNEFPPGLVKRPE